MTRPDAYNRETARARRF